MHLKIDGVDITPYIAHRGFKWKRSDVDGSDAGRDLNGDGHRNRVNTKRRLDITCRPMALSEASIVLTAIMPEYVTVEYVDPQEGGVVTRIMYANNNPATFLCEQPDGTELWEGITFPLVEQ